MRRRACTLQVRRNVPYVLIGGMPFWQRIEIKVLLPTPAALWQSHV